MKSQLAVLSSVLVFSSVLLVAEPISPGDELQARVLAKAAESNNGVIMAITPRGDVAVDTAYLLANQLSSNPGFTPLFMAVEKDKLKGYLGALKLSNEELPALVFFDKSGRELGRVVAAQTASRKLKQMQASSIH